LERKAYPTSLSTLTAFDLDGFFYGHSAVPRCRDIQARPLNSYGPSRETARWRWVTWGSAIAALLWLAVSGLFSWYATSFGKFNETYGSLGAIIGFMTWLWISAIVILLGAEIDAEMEHQTARDTTTGSPRPMGVRGARMADTLGAAQG